MSRPGGPDLAAISFAICIAIGAGALIVDVVRPCPDGLLWTPYSYPNQEPGEESKWWLNAPLGRAEPRRVA